MEWWRRPIPSKWTALWISLGSFALMIPSLSTLPYTPVCVLPTALIGLIFFGIFAAKFYRDFEIAASARRRHPQLPQIPGAPVVTTPLMTDPGNEGLFVPPPVPK